MSDKIRFASEQFVDNRIELDGDSIIFPQGQRINLSAQYQNMWLWDSGDIFFLREEETIKDKINKSLLLSTPEAIHFDGKCSNKDYVIVDDINLDLDGQPLKLIYVFFSNIKMGLDNKSEGVLTMSPLLIGDDNETSDSHFYLKSDNYLLSNPLYDLGFPYNVLTEQDNEVIEILGKNINFPKAGLYLFTLQIEPESLVELGISELPIMYVSAYSGGFITSSSEENLSTELYCNLTISSDGTITVNNNEQSSSITGTLIQSGYIDSFGSNGATDTSRINKSFYEFSYQIDSENYNTLKEQLRISEKIKIIFSNEEKLLYGITNSYSEIGYMESLSYNGECNFSGLYFNFGSILVRLYKESGTNEPI